MQMLRGYQVPSLDELANTSDDYTEVVDNVMFDNDMDIPRDTGNYFIYLHILSSYFHL